MAARGAARGRVRLRRCALGALVAAGVAVQLLGASIYWDHYIRMLIAVKDQTGAGGWYQEHLSHGHYIPAFSPLRGQWWLLRHLIHDDPELDRDAPWKSVVPYPVEPDRGVDAHAPRLVAARVRHRSAPTDAPRSRPSLLAAHAVGDDGDGRVGATPAAAR